MSSSMLEMGKFDNNLTYNKYIDKLNNLSSLIQQYGNESIVQYQEVIIFYETFRVSRF